MALTEKMCEELYNNIRRSIRYAAITNGPEGLWKKMKSFEPDPAKSVPVNRNYFLSYVFPEFEIMDLPEFSRPLAQLTAEPDETIHKMKKEMKESKDAFYALIDLYIYYKIARIMYVEDLHEFFYGGSDKYRQLFDVMTHNDNSNDDYIYDLEEDLLKETAKHKNFRYVNEPFMAVGFNSGFISCVTMEYSGDIIHYHHFEMNKFSNRLHSGTTWMQNTNYDIVFEHVNIDEDDQIIVMSGFTLFNYYNASTRITEMTKLTDEELYCFSTNEVTKTSFINKMKKFSDNEEAKKGVIKLTKSESVAMLNYALAVRKCLNIYLERAPEIKECFDKIDRMAPQSKEALESEHPSIVNIDYTKYVYLDEDGKPIRRKHKGGTHASPREHTRSGCMRYNHKTGLKDIPVRGCTVNEGKSKTQYYKNTK